MSAPDYKFELQHLRFPVDENTRPVSVLYTFDPATNTFQPVTSVGVTGVGAVLNTNIVGGIMQVENLHVEMESTGIRNATDDRINPGTEETLQDILEALGGGSTVAKISRYGEANAPYDTPTSIIDYVVPANSRFRLDSVRGWASVDVEFYVKIDALQVDGYRTTPANLTMSIESMSVQYATAGQHVVIGATQFKAGSIKTVKAVLQGALEGV